MIYLSAIIYISIIPDFNELVNESSLSLPVHGWVGARATPFLTAFFAKQKKTKFGGGKARGEAPSEAGNANFTKWLHELNPFKLSL